MTNLNHDQRHKYHHLITTLHLTVKMTTTQVVETSVTDNNLSNDYPHPDDYTSMGYGVWGVSNKKKTSVWTETA